MDLVEDIDVNLMEKTETLLERAWPWYPKHMLSRRVSLARERFEDLSAVVMDGNAKLAGRICGRPAANIVSSPDLNMWTVTCCERQPLFKKRRCTFHDTSVVPRDPFPPQAEVITAHRRCGNPREGEPYDVLLKPRDDLTDSGRWCAAADATPGWVIAIAMVCIHV